jgi:hypothetical protein
MPIQTITLSSANLGASGAAALNWRSAEAMSVSVFASTTGTSSGTWSLQYTLDDLMLVGGSSLAYWQGVSSATGQPATVFGTSNPDGVYFQFVAPVAAVRMNSTSLSSGPLTMKVLQGEGG